MKRGWLPPPRWRIPRAWDFAAYLGTYSTYLGYAALSPSQPAPRVEREAQPKSALGLASTDFKMPSYLQALICSAGSYGCGSRSPVNAH